MANVPMHATFGGYHPMNSYRPDDTYSRIGDSIANTIQKLPGALHDAEKWGVERSQRKADDTFNEMAYERVTKYFGDVIPGETVAKLRPKPGQSKESYAETLDSFVKSLDPKTYQLVQYRVGEDVKAQQAAQEQGGQQGRPASPFDLGGQQQGGATEVPMPQAKQLREEVDTNPSPPINSADLRRASAAGAAGMEGYAPTMSVSAHPPTGRRQPIQPEPGPSDISRAGEVFGAPSAGWNVQPDNPNWEPTVPRQGVTVNEQNRIAERNAAKSYDPSAAASNYFEPEATAEQPALSPQSAALSANASPGVASLRLTPNISDPQLAAMGGASAAGGQSAPSLAVKPEPQIQEKFLSPEKESRISSLRSNIANNKDAIANYETRIANLQADAQKFNRSGRYGLAEKTMTEISKVEDAISKRQDRIDRDEERILKLTEMERVPEKTDKWADYETKKKIDAKYRAPRGSDRKEKPTDYRALADQYDKEVKTAESDEVSRKSALMAKNKDILAELERIRKSKRGEIKTAIDARKGRIAISDDTKAAFAKLDAGTQSNINRLLEGYNNLAEEHAKASGVLKGARAKRMALYSEAMDNAPSSQQPFVNSRRDDFKQEAYKQGMWLAQSKKGELKGAAPTAEAREAHKRYLKSRFGMNDEMLASAMAGYDKAFGKQASSPAPQGGLPKESIKTIKAVALTVANKHPEAKANWSSWSKEQKREFMAKAMKEAGADSEKSPEVAKQFVNYLGELLGGT